MSPYDDEHDHANVPSALDKTQCIYYSTLGSQTFKNSLPPKGSHLQFLINKLNSIFMLVINFSYSRKSRIFYGNFQTSLLKMSNTKKSHLSCTLKGHVITRPCGSTSNYKSCLVNLSPTFASRFGSQQLPKEKVFQAFSLTKSNNVNALLLHKKNGHENDDQV